MVAAVIAALWLAPSGHMRKAEPWINSLVHATGSEVSIAANELRAAPHTPISDVTGGRISTARAPNQMYPRIDEGVLIADYLHEVLGSLIDDHG